MLKYKLSKEAFDELSDVEKTFYKKDGDGYTIQIDGAVDKAKLNEFRDNNIALSKEIEGFKGVDLEKYNKALAAEGKLREEQLLKDKDFDTWYSEKSAVERSDFEAKITTLTDELTESKSGYSSLISKHEIEGAATKAFSKYKISPDANAAVMAQIRAKFVINNGSVVAMSGDTIETGKDGNLSIDEFVSSQPECFKVPSNGGRGNGGGGGEYSDAHVSSINKISAGLKKLQGG